MTANFLSGMYSGVIRPNFPQRCYSDRKSEIMFCNCLGNCRTIGRMQTDIRVFYLEWAFVVAPHSSPPQQTSAKKDKEGELKKQGRIPGKRRAWSCRTSLNFHVVPFGDSSHGALILSHIHIMFVWNVKQSTRSKMSGNTCPLSAWPLVAHAPRPPPP